MKKNCFSIFSLWRKYKILLYLNLTVILLLSQTFCLSAAGSEGKSNLLDNPQQVTVRGTVTDASTKEALPGVNVIVPGTTLGAITDISGNFTLEVPSASVKLQFSFIGYTMQEVALAGQTTLNIALVSDIAQLNEVVVVGFGTQKKVNLTGAVSSVGAANLATATVANISNNLTGKLPGLRVQNYGSEPGDYSQNSMDIRGWGTMLVIVDGIPRDDFVRLDPSSIESVSILKDASAAVYGVKAANGVMLVTTKKGVAGESNISINSSWGFEYMTDYPKANNNSITDLILKNEAALVAGQALPYPNYLDYTGANPLYPNNDWWKLTVRDKMPMSKNDITFSGGTDRMTYYVSFGQMHQSGIYKTNSMNYDRYNMKTNLTANIVKGLTANVVISGLADFRSDPYGSSAYDFMKQVWMQPCYEPVYANNTSPYYYDGQADRNPLAIINSDLTGYRQYRTKRVETTTSLTYDVPFVKGLQIKGLFAYDMKFDLEKDWQKTYNEYKYNASDNTYPKTPINVPTRLQYNMNEYVYPQTQLSIDYKHSFESGHNIEAMVLLDRRNGSGTYFYGRSNYDITAIDQLSAGLTANQVANGYDRVMTANEGLVGRLNYSYKSKYLAEISARYDASSLFPANSRWGVFPGISLGWRLSEESFIKDNLTFISNLKLRASWGKLGDDSGATGFNFISGYNYPANVSNSTTAASYMFDGASLTSGSISKGLANPDITWYQATTTDIGLDGTMWHGLLDFTVDVWSRVRTGLLATRAEVLPLEFGASFPQQNLNSDYSKGFEISVGHSQKINDFTYSVRANVSFTKQENLHVESAAAGNSYLNWRNFTQDRFKNVIWGYGYTGQFQTQEEINTYPIVQSTNGWKGYFPGDIKYEDWNGDGMIDANDVYPIGKGVDPETYYGLELNGGWKGFALNILLQGASDYTQMQSEQTFGPLPWGRNSMQIFNDRWHHQDPLDFSTPWVAGTYPITRDGFGFSPNKNTSPFWLHKVSYLRLKSVELSYSLPTSLLKVIHAKGVRVYTNSYNTLTWKKKGVLWDPEKRMGGESTGSNNGYMYPVMASYNFGLELTF